MAAEFPLWPGAPLVNEPDLLGLLPEHHVDAGLSADANSTCIRGKQGSLPHTIPNSGLPLAGSQEYAKLPARVYGTYLRFASNLLLRKVIIWWRGWEILCRAIDDYPILGWRELIILPDG